MKKNAVKTFGELSFQYELSSSIRRQFSTIENCTAFINVLIKREHLVYAAIWIKNSFIKNIEQDRGHTLQHAFPKNYIDKTSLQQNSYLACQLENDLFKIVTENDADFEHYIQEKNITDGAFAIYNLRDLGFIKIYTKQKDIFSNEELLFLNDPIDKFSLQLECCLINEVLKKEKEKRITLKQALLAMEKKYDFLLENISEGVIITDLNGRIIFVNEQMAKLSGYEKAALEGLNSEVLLARDEDKKLLRSKIKKRAEGATETYTTEHIRKNGETWLGKINASPYTDIHGKIIGTFGSVTDITHQREATEAIRQSNKKYMELFHRMHDALFFVDNKSYILECNNSGKLLLGYEESAEVNLCILDIIHPDDFEASKQQLKKLRKEGFFKNHECRIFTKQGELKYVQVNSTGIFKEGELISTQDIVRDITAKKKTEKALIQAKQTAEAARHTERQFLANMSHEIRTPMNTVIGMTHLLYDSNPSESQKEIINSLLFSADSLMSIIDNILDLSKIEAGELALEERNFNLQELLKILHKTYQLKIQNKPITLSMEIDESIQHLLIGDRVRLSQILINLLGNSIKFTHEGTIGLKVKVLHSNTENSIIQFHVHDTGIGIAPDKLNYIFDTFKQADLRITRKYGGTGLGLTIVKQLAELQGGAIRAESQQGKGSDFFVILPFKNTNISAAAVVPKNEARPDSGTLLKNIRILVVEDNLMNQKLMGKILEQWDSYFTFASSGEEAIVITENQIFDIIFMDIHMPEMDGCDTTKLIRGNPQNPNHDVPIIALTAAALLEERNRAMAAGMNEFLTKPCSPVQLKQTVIKYTSGREVSNKAVAPDVEQATSQTSVQKSASFDLSYLQEMANGDQTFIRDMIDIFLNEIPKGLDQIQSGINNKDFGFICGTAHRIKSNYMMMGMKKQQEAALTIEKMIKNEQNDLETIKEIWLRLKAESESVYTPLRTLLEEELGTIMKPG